MKDDPLSLCDCLILPLCTSKPGLNLMLYAATLDSFTGETTGEPETGTTLVFAAY